MTRVYSKALDKAIKVDRIIGHLKGPQKGPTLVFMGGVHGNEPSGIFALNHVIKEIDLFQNQLRGSIWAISGNLWALENGVRYHKEDLNRLWTKENVASLKNPSPKDNGVSNDVKEQRELYKLIKSILATENGPFYFFDLHTTSSATIPFLTVNDSMLNRKYTIQYPLPIILGIEEYLDGPLLSYINEKGYVAFGYEAGQHDDMSSIENHIAFVYLSLVFTGVLKEDTIDYHHYYDLLAKTAGDKRKIYEIYFRYKIRPHEDFKMMPGYFNFQLVGKGEKLAESNGMPIKTTHKGRIFMPLYQSQGEEGFFAIREIPSIFLALSALLRKVKLDRFLTLLPGVQWGSDQKDTLIVNRRIAFIFAKQFFHLLGYRSKRMDRSRLIMKNREANSRKEDYEGAEWYSAWQTKLKGH